MPTSKLSLANFLSFPSAPYGDQHLVFPLSITVQCRVCESNIKVIGKKNDHQLNRIKNLFIVQQILLVSDIENV